VPPKDRPPRKVILQMHVSVDGCADGDVRIVPEFDGTYWSELDQELAKTGAANVDTILFGRGTFEEFAGFWPKAATAASQPPSVREAARFYNSTAKVVFSSTLTKTEWKGSRVVKGDLEQEIDLLKHLPGKNLLVPGGVRFPRALAEKNLVDEYLLTVVPMILGKGSDRLFGDGGSLTRLKLLRSRVFSNGAIFQHYEPLR
jgi:dihydrofolate reductase